MTDAEKFLSEHGQRIARVIDLRIENVQDRRSVAEQNYWHAIVRSCDEEIAELEKMLAELERMR